VRLLQTEHKLYIRQLKWTKLNKTKNNGHCVVILQVIRSECMSMSLYGLKACSRRELVLHFGVSRFSMKLFKTDNMDIVSYCRTQFLFYNNRALVPNNAVRRLLENIVCVTVYL